VRVPALALLLWALGAGFGTAPLPNPPPHAGEGMEGASGRLHEQVQLCNACHGESGVPQDKLVPIIWGQHQGYLYLQLRDYKRGDRTHDQMTAVVEPLEREDMLALAEYFSKKPWPRVTRAPAKDDVAMRAERANVAVGCTGCHQDQYRGDGTQARLAGQTPDYLLRTMLETRSGVRGNNPGMTTLLKSIGEDDIAALADYLAGLVITPR
jgi:cytochrome c553